MWIKYHIEKVTVSGGVATISDTLSASASTVMPSGGTSGEVDVTLYYGPTIHAQPYHMVQTSSSVSSGVLNFDYAWYSTDGHVGDIDAKTVFVYEIVKYPGGNPYWPGTPYDPDSKFTNPQTDEPTSPTVTNGADPGDQGGFYDHQYVPAADSPYSANDFTATQKYGCDDFDTGETGANRIVLMSGLTIERKITNAHSPYTDWWYSCTKSSLIGWLELGN